MILWLGVPYLFIALRRILTKLDYCEVSAKSVKQTAAVPETVWNRLLNHVDGQRLLYNVDRMVSTWKRRPVTNALAGIVRTHNGRLHYGLERERCDWPDLVLYDVTEQSCYLCVTQTKSHAWDCFRQQAQL